MEPEGMDTTDNYVPEGGNAVTHLQLTPCICNNAPLHYHPHPYHTSQPMVPAVPFQSSQQTFVVQAGSNGHFTCPPPPTEIMPLPGGGHHFPSGPTSGRPMQNVQYGFQGPVFVQDTQYARVPQNPHEEHTECRSQQEGGGSSTHSATAGAGNINVDGFIKEVEKCNFKKELVQHGVGQMSGVQQYSRFLFCLHGLPLSVSEDTLINYVEVCGDLDVKKVEYTLDKTTALVSVEQEPDWTEFDQKTKEKQLEKTSVTIQRMMPPRSICIQNMPKRVKKDVLYQYFISKQRNTTSNINFYNLQDMIVITFEDPADVEAVLLEKTHLIEGEEISVSVFFEELGPVQEMSDQIVEEEVMLTTGEGRLLLVSGKLREMQKHVDIDLKRGGQLVIKDEQKKVAEAKDQIKKLRSTIIQSELNCSLLKKKYLKDEASEKLMFDRIREKKIQSVWYFDSDHVKICAFSQSDSNRMKTWIIKHLKEEEIDLKSDEADLDSQFRHIKRELETKEFEVGTYMLEYDSSQRKILLIAQHEEFHDILEDVKKMILQFCSSRQSENKRQSQVDQTGKYRSSVTETLRPDHQQFIKKFKSEEIITMTGIYGVEVNLDENERTVVISGNKEYLNDALQYFKDIVKSLHFDIKPLSSQESSCILKSAYLECLKTYVGDSERCVISHRLQLDEGKQDDSAEGAVGGAVGGHGHGTYARQHHHNSEEMSSSYSPPRSQPGRVRRQERIFSHGPKIKIVLKDGEIAKESADIIVNTVANGFDMKSGQLSRSILYAGGRKFQDECTLAKGDLHEGGYVKTSGGKLSCKFVFHCCLPPAISPTAGESVQDVLKKMLKDADDLSAKTMSIPALGTGGLGHDPEVIANIMYASVNEYSPRAQNIKEIRFVIYKNPKVFKAFLDVQKASSSSEKANLHRQRLAEVKSGEIATEKVDVIVNTSNQNLHLGYGAVSKSILKNGGNKVQVECNKIIEKQKFVIDWKFEHTSGGDLNCKRIYHCCLPKYYTSYDVQKLKQLTMDMLEGAHRNDNKSIAFPALGTGSLGYPRDQVAKAMFEAVKDFRKKYLSTSLKDIRFVIYPKDGESLKAFKEAEKLAVGGSSYTGSSYTGSSYTGSSYTGSSGSNATPETPPRTQKIHVCSMLVLVKQGDLSQMNIDAVVNPIDSNMTWKGNVYKALLKVGGTDFERETSQKREELKHNRIANVNLRKGFSVIHIDRAFIDSNQKQAILKCLKHADAHKYKTVGFPILQTGDSSKRMAEDLCEAIKLFKKHPKDPTTIEKVFIVIFKKDQFYSFAQQLQKKASGVHSEEDFDDSENGNESITFTIVSDDRTNISKAKSKLMKFCDENTDVDVTLTLPPSITLEEIREIGLQNESILVENKPPVRLKGNAVHVLKAIDDFYSMLRQKSKDWQGNVSDDGVHLSLLGKPDKEYKSYKASSPQQGGTEVQDAWKSSHDGAQPHTWDKGSSHFNQTLNYSPTSSMQEKLVNESGGDDRLSSSETSKKYYDGYNKPGSLETRELGGTATVDDAAGKPRSPYIMQWFYVDPDTDTLQSYGENVSSQIEKSFVSGMKQHKLQTEADGEQFIIDFESMEEYPDDNPSDCVAVLRKEKIIIPKNLDPPDSWSPMGDDKVKVQMVNTSDLNSDNVACIDEIQRTKNVSLLKIEKIQNLETHQRYETKKMDIEKNAGSADIEKTLWLRCTTTDAIVPVNSWGVTATYCGQKHRGSLGEGVELTASFSDIVRTNIEGNQYAYLCKVLVGISAQGKPGLRDPPPQVADTNSFYDSVVDDVTTPSKYMVFSDAQIEPEYLITFKVSTE